MKTDYAYCDNHKCIHRRGCKRWIGNYCDEELDEWVASKRQNWINHVECESNLSDANCKNNYGLLDRFRNSDGTKLKDKNEN